MHKRLSLLPLLLVMLAACSPQEPAAEAEAAPQAPASEPAAPAEATPAEAEADTGDGADIAATAPAGTDADADADASAPARPAPQAPQGPEPVAGTHYTEIANAQPYQPLQGKIEVVEVFGYTCPACAQFAPALDAWKQRQPDDVRVTMVAAPFGGYWMPYAQAFYTAESMGLVERTHAAMFEAVHRKRSLPVQGVTDQQIADFYAGFGADAAQFASTMKSFTVSAKMRGAQQFLTRTGVDSTPTIIVNGKYRVLGPMAYDEVLRVTDHLIARERAAAAAE